MTLRSPTVAVLATLALALPACGDDEQPVADCGLVAFTPQSDDGAFEIRARGVDCTVARSVARGSRDVRASAPRYRARGFACTGGATGGDDALPGTAYRCTRGDATVTFTRH